MRWGNEAGFHHSGTSLRLMFSLSSGMLQPMGNKKAYMQAFRARRLAQGLCTRCGKNPHRPGRKTCGCDTEYLNRRKQGRVDNRKCWECADPLDEEEIYKRCETCRKDMYERKKQRQARNLATGLCSQCAKRPHIEGQKRCAVCRDKERARALQIKQEVLAHYGGSCVCCDEPIQAFLTMDHSNGGGTAHRKTIGHGSIYKWLRGQGFPEGFQVLCFNCNCGRSVNGGVCPHQESE